MRHSFSALGEPGPPSDFGNPATRYYEAVHRFGPESAQAAAVFEEIWRNWYGPVERSLINSKIPVYDAEQVTLQVFERCERMLRTRVPTAPLETTIWHCQKVECAEYWRKQLGRRAGEPIPTPVSLDSPAGQATLVKLISQDIVTETIEQQEMDTWVHRVLSELGRQDQAILRARLSGLSTEETAQLLHIRTGAAKMRFTRAAKRFAEKWRVHQETKDLR